MGKAPMLRPYKGCGLWSALRRLMVSLCVVILLMTGDAASSQIGGQKADEDSDVGGEQPGREYLIKAAILYNFAKFISWPKESFSNADASLQLCVIGKNPFGTALASVEGKRVHTRRLATRVIPDTSHIGRCHLLFVSTSEGGRLDDILSATDGTSILTVSEMPGFSRAGGMITLKIVEDRTRFDINRLATNRAGLKLSAKLLRLADRVIQN